MKKFNVSHNTYKNFKEIEKLPEIGDNYDGRKVIAINEIGMDCEQPFDDNFNYDLYEIVCEDEDVNAKTLRVLTYQTLIQKTLRILDICLCHVKNLQI